MAVIYRVDFRSPAQRLRELREAIIDSYAPYHLHAEFHVGLLDYESFAAGGELRSNPYDSNSVAAQAWDRGREAGMQIRITTAGPTCQGWRPRS
jgi:hypothetical protein